MMTVSAEARLMPRPPARVDSRKQEYRVPSSRLKRSIRACLSALPVRGAGI